MDPSTDKLVALYFNWLKTKTDAVHLDGAYQITTPFQDRHNDRLQIYVVPTDTGYRLTDDGYIIGDLETCGCQLDTTNRKALLKTILNGFGVNLDNGELSINATLDDFPRKKHSLLQAMLAVNDMFMTAKQRVISLFIEDVQRFLNENAVRFTPAVEFTGKSGFSHKFDFVIPKSAAKPERLIRAINIPTRDAATTFLFAWTDTKDVRPPKSQAYAILNDQDKSVSADVRTSLEHYDVKVLPWSQRQKFARELAA